MNDGNKSYNDLNEYILKEFDHAEMSRILNERFHDLPGGYRLLPLDSSNCGFCKHWDKYTGYCAVVDNFKCEGETCDQFKQRDYMLKFKCTFKNGQFKITLDNADDALFRKD